MIELQHVSKTFENAGGRVDALRDVSLTIADGDIYGIIGMSGAGKSTLVRCINMLERPTEGRVIVNGQQLDAMTPAQLRAARREITMIFQRFNLLMQRTCLQNICFPMELAGVGRKEAQAKAWELLKLVGLPDKAQAYPAQLSGGQQQRIAIARALVNEPEVLLLDEPLGALDLKLRKEMQLELKSMQQQLGITFIYVTHDQEEALTMSDTIVVMRDGHILQIGDPKSVYDEPANAFVANFIGESNILRGTMIEDELVHFCGFDFPCVDSGFGENAPVDVVIRPEDIMIVGEDIGQLTGVVQSVLFKGVHYEMMIDTGETVFKVHSTIMQPQGSRVGLTIVPYNIHIMHPMPEPPVDEEAIADV